jgi:hypothetical protein
MLDEAKGLAEEAQRYLDDARNELHNFDAKNPDLVETEIAEIA